MSKNSNTDNKTEGENLPYLQLKKNNLQAGKFKKLAVNRKEVKLSVLLKKQSSLSRKKETSSINPVEQHYRGYSNKSVRPANENTIHYDDLINTLKPDALVHTMLSKNLFLRRKETSKQHRYQSKPTF